MTDPHMHVVYQFTTALTFFDMSTYVKTQRPTMHHLPVGPWRDWWASNYRGKVRVVGDPGARDPARGPDLAFALDSPKVGLLGVENASRRVGERLDALDAYIRGKCSREPFFCILWMWASCVEDRTVDEPEEYDEKHPFYTFDKVAPDGARLIERAKERARRLSRDSDVLWVLAVREWKKGKDRGCKGLFIHTVHRGRDLCLIPRFVYRD